MEQPGGGGAAEAEQAKVEVAGGAGKEVFAKALYDYSARQEDELTFQARGKDYVEAQA